jgi:hypothetical protein
VNKKEDMTKSFTVIENELLKIYAIEDHVYFKNIKYNKFAYINLRQAKHIVERLQQYLKATELKPCPDCSYKFPKIEFNYLDNGAPIYQVKCGNWECQKTQPAAHDYLQAIKDWNENRQESKN